MIEFVMFTCPKDLGKSAHIDRIQANAFYSWEQQEGLIDFLLTGGILQSNDYGTPLVPDIFTRAEIVFNVPYYMYSNADILYQGGAEHKDDIYCVIDHCGAAFKRFLVVGRRWDIQIDFDVNSPETLQKAYELPAEWHQPAGMDYFIFPRGTFDYSKWPAFALGRFRWDNWIVWHALDQGIPVIDASLVIKPLHQNHDYAHFSPSAQEEIDRNGALARASGCNKWCTTEDATHYFSEDWVLHERKKP